MLFLQLLAAHFLLPVNILYIQHVVWEVINVMTMRATVLNVQDDRLLVFDHAMSQNVIVFTPDARRFCVGNHVLIRYSGIMTMSIPPQITAIGISVIPRFGPFGGMFR